MPYFRACSRFRCIRLYARRIQDGMGQALRVQTEERRFREAGRGMDFMNIFPWAGLLRKIFAQKTDILKKLPCDLRKRLLRVHLLARFLLTDGSCFGWTVWLRIAAVLLHKEIVLLIQIIAGDFQCLAETLEMHNFAFPQEPQRRKHLWIIRQVDQVFIGAAGLLLCCTSVSAAFFVLRCQTAGRDGDILLCHAGWGIIKESKLGKVNLPQHLQKGAV